MNALSFISRSRSASRSASQASRTRDRTPSLSTQTTAYGSDESTSQDLSSITGSIDSEEPDQDSKTDDESSTHERDMAFADESTPLLDTFTPTTLSNLTPTKSSSWRNIPSRISNGFVGAVKVIVRVIVSPFAYVIACFYDETGGFSPLLPFFTIARVARPKKRRRISNGAYGREKADQLLGDAARPPTRRKRGGSIEAAAVVDTDSLSEKMDDTPVSRHTRSRSSISSTSTEEQPSSNRRSIRIKLNNDPSKPRRKRLEAEAATSESAHDMLAASLKSPPSSTHAAHKASLMKYPKAPLPPRPLVPRRQPSYTKIPASLALLGPSAGPHKKTLILDLDETLIHSHSKGGRFTTGHMVEVRLQHSLGHGGVMIGPQVPILYYVHKRPYCDEFLRKVSKWYNLVIFTASVQEYADPVIDWLELERKYFAARYYRQHCTYRTGAYIKDISQVEPDLSKVLIIDNSPLCYAFHEDNAVPIEGWISDPTDRDLMHLVPMLEGLQYSTDVRALLALRRGQEKLEAA